MKNFVYQQHRDISNFKSQTRQLLSWKGFSSTLFDTLFLVFCNLEVCLVEFTTYAFTWRVLRSPTWIVTSNHKSEIEDYHSVHNVIPL